MFTFISSLVLAFLMNLTIRLQIRQLCVVLTLFCTHQFVIRSRHHFFRITGCWTRRWTRFRTYSAFIVARGRTSTLAWWWAFEHFLGFFLSLIIFIICNTKLQRPMNLLSLFSHLFATYFCCLHIFWCLMSIDIGVVIRVFFFTNPR